MKQTDYEQQAFSPAVFGRRNGICRTTVFEEIKSGRLDARKVGRRTIITRQAEKAWQVAYQRPVPEWQMPPRRMPRHDQTKHEARSRGYGERASGN
jgi:hypothetical protein